MNLVPDFFRIFEIDRVDLEQSKVALTLLRTADHPFDRITRTQAKPTNLRWGHIDIVWSREIIGVRGAQKSKAVLQHLNHAFADNLNITACELFENGKH